MKTLVCTDKQTLLFGALQGYLLYNLPSFVHFSFQSVGAALFYTLEKHLGKKFTSKVKEAWTAVYGIMANSEGSVTDEQISLVQDSWHLVKKDLEKLGVEFYVR